MSRWTLEESRNVNFSSCRKRGLSGHRDRYDAGMIPAEASGDGPVDIRVPYAKRNRYYERKRGARAVRWIRL